MKFGEALELLKQGCKVSTSMFGKDVYIVRNKSGDFYSIEMRYIKDNTVLNYSYDLPLKFILAEDWKIIN